jgi:hypothetical protein
MAQAKITKLDTELNDLRNVKGIVLAGVCISGEQQLLHQLNIKLPEQLKEVYQLILNMEQTHDEFKKSMIEKFDKQTELINKLQNQIIENSQIKINDDTPIRRYSIIDEYTKLREVEDKLNNRISKLEIKEETKKEESVIPYVKIIYDEKWVEETYKDFLNWLKTQIKNEIHASELFKNHDIPYEFYDILNSNCDKHTTFHISTGYKIHLIHLIEHGIDNLFIHNNDIIEATGNISETICKKIINPLLLTYLKKRNINVYQIDTDRRYYTVNMKRFLWQYEP